MLIFANPVSTKPARRRSTKGPKMATRKRKSTKRRATSRRRVTRNPAPAKRRRRSYRLHSNPVKRRRRVHRNPGFSGSVKGVLGELASMNGVILLGSAVLAPTVTNMAVSFIVPVQYQDGYTGLLAKVAFVAAGTYALDRLVKSRHAALGFAIGGLGTVINDGINVMRTRQALPATVPPAVSDEIARNPAAFNSLMDGSYNSLNGYQSSPMSGYDQTAMADSDFDSLN